MDQARTTLRTTLLLSYFYCWRVKRRLTFEQRRKANNNKQSLHSLSASYGSDFNLNYRNFHSNTEWEVLLWQVNIRLWAFSFSSLYFHVCSNVPPWYVLILQASRIWAPIFWHTGTKRWSNSTLLETTEHYCSINTSLMVITFRWRTWNLTLPNFVNMQDKYLFSSKTHYLTKIV